MEMLSAIPFPRQSHAMFSQLLFLLCTGGCGSELLNTPCSLSNEELLCLQIPVLCKFQFSLNSSKFYWLQTPAQQQPLKLECSLWAVPSCLCPGWEGSREGTEPGDSPGQLQHPRPALECPAQAPPMGAQLTLCWLLWQLGIASVLMLNNPDFNLLSLHMFPVL